MIKYIIQSTLIFALVCNVAAQINKNNRAIILTDIENEPDDTESMIRLLLYSNEIDIKGLIATTSVHMKNEVHPETIIKLINTYGKVQPNLLKHNKGYPLASSLLSLVKSGLPMYGMQGVGDGKDSEGSDWIIRVLEENDDRPLWISVWGGANTLSQALYKLKQIKSPKDLDRMVSKLRVYTISDQDDSGIWIRKNFPDLFYIVSPGGYFSSTWLAISLPAKGMNNESISNAWIAKNIQQDHGPLGAMYPDVAYGMEGDTPSWLPLIQNGLNDINHPEWGSWGGRYLLYKPDSIDKKGFTGGVPVEDEPRAIWTNAIDSFVQTIPNAYGKAIKKDSFTIADQKASIWRWRDDFQNDFAARMDWCTKSYKDANHAPVAMLAHSDRLMVKSGENFRLNAGGTYDPDGDNLSYQWIQYKEASSIKSDVKFNQVENIYRQLGTAPIVTKPETIHMILKVTDKGSPPMSSYKRVIITVEP